MVSFGEFEFDPISTSECYLSIISNKRESDSHLLSPLIDQLSRYNQPVIVIDGSRNESSSRSQDSNLVTIGSPKDGNVDLSVEITDLELVGKWVLEDKQQLRLDVSSYSPPSKDCPANFLVVAETLRSLNDHALRKSAGEQLNPVICVIKDTDVLVPELDGSDIESRANLNQCRMTHLEQCRLQMQRLLSEGSDSGIRIFSGIRRPRKLYEPIFRRCEDFIIHSIDDRDIELVSDQSSCSEDLLSDLGPDQLIAKGPIITDGKVVGPTSIHEQVSPQSDSRRSNDSGIAKDKLEFLQLAREELNQVQRTKRAEYVEWLTKEPMRLQRRLDRSITSVTDIDDLLSRLGTGSTNEVSTAERPEKLTAILLRETEQLELDDDDYQALMAELAREKGALNKDRRGLEDFTEKLEIDLKKVDTRITEARVLADLVIELFGPSEGSFGKTATNSLNDEAIATSVSDDSPPEVENSHPFIAFNNRDESTAVTYDDFAEDPIIKAIIRDVMKEDGVTPRYVKGLIDGIHDARGPVNYREIADRVGISTVSHISSAASALRERGILKTTNKSPPRVDFNRENHQNVKKQFLLSKQLRRLLDTEK